LRPDLIVMDVMMAGLDGPSTLKRMREHVLLADIPVIFLTAKVLAAEVAHLLQLGAIGVIGKPFDPLTLADDLFALWKGATADRGRDISSTPVGRSRVQAQVGSLTGGFLQRTKDDVVRLRSIIARACEDRSVIEEAQRIAHSIHGAGAMFGFPTVSAAGGAIERLSESALSSTATPGSGCAPAVLQQLSALTDQLDREVEASEKTTVVATGMFQGLGSGK
jgi:CheY-like chemotaxis protein